MRTDIHSPSKIIPADYVWVAFEHLPGQSDPYLCEYAQSERDRIRDHMVRTGGTYSQHEHGGNCMVCGSPNAIYTVLFYHAKTNSYVRMGQDCAQKCEMAFSSGQFDAFHTAIRADLDLRAGKRKAEAYLASLDLARAWTIYVNGGSTSNEATISDIVTKLIKYGTISDPQIKFVQALIDRIDNAATIAAQRQAERDAASPIPAVDGRMDIEGTVVSIKPPDEYAQYPQVKIVVKSDSGWVVWGSLPKSISDCERGDKVRFSAVVRVSDSDPKFGFYSRPTKANIVTRAQAQAA